MDEVRISVELIHVRNGEHAQCQVCIVELRFAVMFPMEIRETCLVSRTRQHLSSVQLNNGAKKEGVFQKWIFHQVLLFLPICEQLLSFASFTSGQLRSVDKNETTPTKHTKIDQTASEATGVNIARNKLFTLCCLRELEQCWLWPAATVLTFALFCTAGCGNSSRTECFTNTAFLVRHLITCSQ